MFIYGLVQELDFFSNFQIYNKLCGPIILPYDLHMNVCFDFIMCSW